LKGQEIYYFLISLPWILSFVPPRKKNRKKRKKKKEKIEINCSLPCVP
jgi:hypothetical protein